jgi:hypothetical protein
LGFRLEKNVIGKERHPLLSQIRLDQIQDEKNRDPNRMQLYLADVSAKVKWFGVKKAACESMQHAIDLIVAEVKAYLSAKNPEFALSGGAILKSKGGAAQGWHRDFRRDIGLTAEPLVLLIPLCDCQLGFPSGLSDVLHRGSVLFMRGYAKHRGCGYEKDNYRLHFYCVYSNDERLG